MGKISKAIEIANRAVNTLGTVSEGDQVLVVADESAMVDAYPEITDAILALSRLKGAEADLIEMRDSEIGEHYLSTVAQAGMEQADVVIQCTQTTATPVTHHEISERLANEGKIRRVAMGGRTFQELSQPWILDAKDEEALTVAKKIEPYVEKGRSLHLTNELGTDVRFSIDGAYHVHSDVARNPGDFAPIILGELVIGPIVGSTEGTAIFDGPILLSESPWPSPPLEVTFEEGKAVEFAGDPQIAGKLQAMIDEHENGDNVAEFAFGINKQVLDSTSRDVSVVKKKLGTIHMAIGDGQYYGQSVKSDMHVDMVMMEPTVRIDDETILEAGELVA